MQTRMSHTARWVMEIARFVSRRSRRRYRRAPALAALALLLVAALPDVHGAAASGTNTWAPTGTMSTALAYGSTATLLPSGRVLVAGGSDSDSSYAGRSAVAELYDPATGTWTATGSMQTARDNHTATLLPSGKVLVAGGVTLLGTELASAEMYDPATGTWTTTGSMNVAHSEHTATLLTTGPHAGDVLVAGGVGCASVPCSPLISAELFDPATGTWTPTGDMTVPRWGHMATLLPSGRVLVAGGATSSNETATSAELYDPATGTFTPTGSMESIQFYGTATLLDDGAVLVAGGQNAGGNNVATAEVYSPTLGLWAYTGDMTMPRSLHVAALLPSGQVLAAGSGDANSSPPSPASELYTAGATPLISLRPSTLSFMQPVGGSIPQTITLTNAGAQPLTASITLTGTDASEYSVASTCPTTSLASGASCAIRVTFTPHVAGSSTALVSIADNAPGGAHSVGLTGSAFRGVVAFPRTGQPGDPAFIAGGGFAPHEQVALHWGTAQGLLVGTATANAGGAFGGRGDISITVPMSASGSYALYGVGQTSGYAPSTSYRLTAALLSVTPSSGAAGAMVTVAGTHFMPREPVQLLYCARLLCTSNTGVTPVSVTSDANGAFSGVSVRVPPSATAGLHGITALGFNSRGNLVDGTWTPFTVTG